MLSISSGINNVYLNNPSSVCFQKNKFPVMQAQPDTFNGKTPLKQESSSLEKLISFFGKKNKSPIQLKELPKIGPYGVAKNQYRTTLETPVISIPNPNIREDLSHLKKVSSLDVAEKRITSFSNYMLKMVGFITPNGHEWMPNALTNLLYATQGSKIPDDRLINPAREFWSTMAVADGYWTSDHFMNYLEGMDKSPARDACLQALQEIRENKSNKETVSFSGRGKAPRPPLESSFKEVPELLYGAYSAKFLSQTTDDNEHRLTLEHVFPQSNGGLDNDFNFILASGKENNTRGNIPLVKFLKGSGRLI